MLWLLWSLIAAPFRAWGRYRRKQGRVRLIDGLQAYEHGQWQRAEKLLDGAAKDPEVSAVALANAVRSAQARADGPAGEALLQRTGESDATLQALLRAEQLLARDLPVDAINALDVAAIQPLPPRACGCVPKRWRVPAAHTRPMASWVRCARARYCRPNQTANWKPAWPHRRCWKRPTSTHWPHSGKPRRRRCGRPRTWWAPMPAARWP